MLLALNRLFGRCPKVELPLKGFDSARIEIPWIERLSDDAVTRLNSLLQW